MSGLNISIRTIITCCIALSFAFSPLKADDNSLSDTQATEAMQQDGEPIELEVESLKITRELAESLSDNLLDEDAFKKKLLKADISPRTRYAIAAVRGLTLAAFLTVGTYIDENPIESGVSLASYLERIFSDKETTARFLQAGIPGSVSGIESAAFAVYYEKFQEFLSTPKYLYFKTEARIKKSGRDPKSKSFVLPLMMAKEFDSLARGGVTEYIYLLPVFALTGYLGFEHFATPADFFLQVLYSTSLVTVAQTGIEIVIGNVMMKAKARASSTRRAVIIQGLGNTAAAIVSIVTTGAGVLHGIKNPYGTELLENFAKVGVALYGGHLVIQYVKIMLGKEKILLTEQTSEQYFQEKRTQRRKAKEFVKSIPKRTKEYVTSKCQSALSNKIF